MRNFFLFITVSIFLLLGTACSQQKSNKGNEKWKLVWEDDFSGKQIDTTKWSKIPRGTSDWNNYMSDYDKLYDIKDGNLVLRGMQNTVLSNDTASYLTGGVYTRHKKTFGLGRIEIRAKLNPAKGAWPAFWMLPEIEEWPVGGEIDILERLNHEKAIYQTVHSTYTSRLGIKDNPPASSYVRMNLNDYNVYALEKYQDSLVFYVNDTRTKNYPRIETDIEGQFPFADNEFYLLLDMQLGGSWVGTINPAELPVEMCIDWVRFYEQRK